MRSPRRPGRAGRTPRVLVVLGASCGSRSRSLVPLRHWVVPGDYRWTNEGYRFAWVVLLTEKGGDVSFRVREPATGREWIETAQDLYTPTQWRVMATEPELIRQAAHAIAERQAAGGRDVEVRADAFVSLNGRPAQRLDRPARRPRARTVAPPPALDPPGADIVAFVRYALHAVR